MNEFPAKAQLSFSANSAVGPRSFCRYVSGVIRLESIIAVLCLGMFSLRAAAPVDFNRDIRPLLSDRCFKCHGPDGGQRRAKLRLDTDSALEAAMVEGIIVPENADESELVKRIFADDPDDLMPPGDSNLKLSDKERELLKRWISEGANHDQHWAFEKPQKPPLPTVSNTNWCRNEIDYFVLAQLDARGLKPAPTVDPRTFIRRVSYDLTGLPPSGREVEAYAKNPLFKALVDHLLASERYGERMAMDWLDVARYADTSGFLYDWPRTMWRWRDWVIKAFNENLSYRDFIAWQLAGDLMPEPDNDQIIATGFNRNHPFTVEAGVIDEEFRVNYVNDRVTTMGTAFLGLTLECARCHDHKFDAISQRDYYQLFAFFNNVPESGVTSPFAMSSAPAVGTPTTGQFAEIAEVDQRVARLTRALMKRDRVADKEQRAWEKTARISHWTPLTATTAKSTEGAQMVVQADQSILVTGPNPSVDQHIFEFIFTNETTITGFRLEALNAINGPGRSANGNALVTFIGAGRYYGELHDALKLSRAGADYSQSDFPVAGAIDTAPFTAWGLAGNRPREERSAVFEFTEPQTFEPGDRMEIKVYYGSPYPQHVLGRLRFSVTELKSPARIDRSGVIGRMVKKPANQRHVSALQFIRYYYRAMVSPRFREISEELSQAETDKAAALASIPQTMIMQESASRPAHVLERGAYDRPGERVQPDTPAALPVFPPAAPRNRLGLAAWLTSREQPLTARVFVNRVWAQFFGRGLVDTPGDFGSQGSWPTHPRLLDWLAVDFMENGWNIKRLMKQIATSATYLQSSTTTPEQLASDPLNRHLARGPRFRLTAEMIRDTALKVGGLLHEQIGGPSVKPYQPAGLWKRLTNRRDYRQTYEQDSGTSLYRRSLYTFWKRGLLHPSMAAFDAPTREVCTVRRRITNTPQQALVLLNDPQFVEAARAFAERILQIDEESRFTFAFREATARAPSDSEIAIIRELLASEQRRFEKDPEAARKLLSVGDSNAPTENLAQRAAYTMVARALLNLSETITHN